MSSPQQAGFAPVVAKFRRRLATSQSLGRTTMVVARRDMEVLIQHCVQMEAAVRCLGAGFLMEKGGALQEDRTTEGGRKKLLRVKGRGIA